MAEDKAAPKKLFDDCVFVFVETNSLSKDVIQALSSIVEEHGARVIAPKRNKPISMVEATHCVSNTIDFPEYVEAAAMMVPVVKSEWIQLSIARGKQCQVRQYSPDPRMIFSSVSLTCADIPVSDRETIIGALIALGGTETKDVTKQTTHICALTMDHPKCAKAVKAGLKCKIVLPHWFDDCFRLGRMIDEGPYLLPDPEILRAGPDEPVPIPQASQHLSGATSTLPNHLPHARIGADGERRPLTVFQDRAVMLGADLVVSPRLRSILEELITQSGGRVVSKPDDCDWLVCHYRDGADYVRASQCGKTVGNLAWLYHVVTRDEWSDPMHRLLHYPIPRNGIPGFEKLAISVSNYGGEARIYLENLITAAGGTFTKTMTKDNTHLVTARDNSEKCAAARDWGIAMVNHLWIEESYARCELQPLTTQKYTHFPPRTNLGEVIGQTYLDERRLRSLYFHGEPDNAPPSAKKARAILDQARANTAPRGPTAGVALGPPQPALAVLSDVGDDNMADARKSKGKAKSSGKHVLLGKENDTGSVASTTASRSAKDRALSTIHGLAEDLQLYEREKKRKGAGVPFGGTRAANQLDRERAAAGTRRKSDDISDAASEDDVDTASARRPAKKSRPSLPEVALRIAVTSYARWSGDMAREDKDRRKLRELGIQVVGDNQPCDLLAAPGLKRTMKFLLALSRGVPLISTTFIDHVLDTSEVPASKEAIASTWALQDEEGARRFSVAPATATKRARANKGRLLWNLPIYCTANVPHGCDSYRAVAEANGAIFKSYGARSGTTIRPTTAEEDGGAPPDPVYLLTGTEPADRDLWPRFRAMAEAGHMEPRIVVVDWLLDVVMQQRLFYDEKYDAEKVAARKGQR